MAAHYVCNRCRAVFSEDEAATETFRHDEVRPTFVESFLCCPHCLSADFEDAAYCYKCKRPISYSNLKGGYYCPDCMKELRDPYHEHLYVGENLDDYAEWIHERRARNNADEQDEKDRTHL